MANEKGTSIDFTEDADSVDKRPTVPVSTEDLSDAELDTEGVTIHLDEDAAEVTAVDADYGADQIQILEGLEAVPR